MDRKSVCQHSKCAKCGSEIGRGAQHRPVQHRTTKGRFEMWKWGMGNGESIKRLKCKHGMELGRVFKGQKSKLLQNRSKVLVKEGSRQVLEGLRMESCHHALCAFSI